jgi:phage tail sheath protein FI
MKMVSAKGLRIKTDEGELLDAISGTFNLPLGFNHPEVEFEVTWALDRINVRRLLIEIKKFFASTARFLVFEQNTAATRNKFLAIVNPYLESVQQRSGLYAFQVVMDDSNNTPDLVDRNILYGQIYLKPTKAAEFIVLDFNVLPTGATFPTA